MRILVVTLYYEPDLGPSAPLMTMLCEDLAASGHQVTVIAAVPHYPSGTVSPELRGRLIQRERLNGVDILRVRVPSGKRDNLRHRLFVFAVFQILASLAGMRLTYDVSVITNPAIETGIPFALLAWLRRRPCLLCVWDIYPEVGVRMGVFRHAWIISVVRWMEDFCLKRANAIHVLGESFIPDLQLHHVPAEKMVVIPPWLDTDFLSPMPRHNSFSRENGLDDRFVILYAGNLGLSQGLENILSAANTLSSQQDICFTFVGDGVNRKGLVARAAELGLENVKFLPFQPRERLPEVLASADLSVVSLVSGIGDGSLPSKTFPILASGRPILAIVDQGSSIWNLVQQYQAGVCVLPNDPERLAQEILCLANDPKSRMELGENGRAYAVQYHSRIYAAQVFGEALNNLTRKRNG